MKNSGKFLFSKNSNGSNGSKWFEWFGPSPIEPFNSGLDTGETYDPLASIPPKSGKVTVRPPPKQVASRAAVDQAERSCGR